MTDRPPSEPRADAAIAPSSEPDGKPPEAGEGLASGNEPGNRAGAALSAAWQSLTPLVLAILAGGILLAVMGRDPIAFYGTVVERGVLSASGRQETIIRMAPLLLIAAGLIVAFRANIWNLGMDGQFLLAVAFTAGLTPPLLEVTPRPVALVVMLVVGGVAGALWALVPALMKAYYGLNEIITTLMMTFIGVNVANLLVKGPFYEDEPGRAFPATEVIAVEDRLPRLFDTRIHIGVILGLIGILVVHYLMTRTSMGLRLNVLGASAKSAHHAGLGVAKLTLSTFLLSGFLIGLGGAVELLGVQGTMRADWDPAWGLLVVPLVFLAKMNGWASIAFVALFAVLSNGGELATRDAGLPNDFILFIVALILIFMTVTDYFAKRRGQGDPWIARFLARIGTQKGGTRAQ